jgi:leader peptidase (prepilin peptidase)/N-methyltransferase
MLYLTPALTAYILIVAFALGAVMGSFSNCLAWRMTHGESVLRGRSHCPKCGHTLSPAELVPIFSWLAQRGRCRSCGEKISVRYPLTELFSGAAFVLVVMEYDVTVKAAMYLVLTLILLIAALTDIDEGIIPNSLIIAAIADFALFTCLGGGDVPRALLRGAAGGFAVAVPLLLLSLLMDRLLKRDSMGGGDIKLFFAAGMFFPFFESLFVLILACVLGIIFALVFPRLRAKSSGDEKAFPFGPAIAASAFVSIFLAQPATAFYLNLF